MTKDGVRPSIKMEKAARHGRCGIQTRRSVQHMLDEMSGRARLRATEMLGSMGCMRRR